MHGMVRKLLNILNRCEEGVQPNDITFICLLSACSHAGLVIVLLCFNGHRLYDFSKIGTLHLHCSPSWPCWPSTGREYGHGNALETTCGSLDGFAWHLQNSW